MLLVEGNVYGTQAVDTEFCGLFYPDGDVITRHMADRLRNEPFYQSDKLEQAMLMVSRRRMAVDCGAWVGGWSRALGQRFDRVLSIEANPNSARCVKRNVQHLPNVEVRNVAVGDSDGRVTLSNGGGGNVGSSAAFEGEGGFEVAQRTLDSMLLGLPAVDYIKVHVNGMELKALQGARQTLRKHKPVMTVVIKPALADFAASADEVRWFLVTQGYKPAGGERPYEIWVPA